MPGPLVTAEEDSNDLLLLNNTLTEAMLVVFHVADGSVLGSGFSATYGSTRQGQMSAIAHAYMAHMMHDVSCMLSCSGDLHTPNLPICH